MKNKKGISLIVLIITIIVVIILATVVILSLNNNNPISSAKEATFKSDIQSIQDELSMYISKKYADNQGDLSSLELEGDDMVAKLPSTKKYKDSIIIENGKMKYVANFSDEQRISWIKEIGITVVYGVQAKDVDETYYGKEVSNYTFSDSSITGITWKVFYADDSNIYLISSDYIDPSLLPAKNGVSPNIRGTGYPKSAYFTNIVSQYNGSSDITDSKLKALNNDYFNVKNYTSTNANMKAVAYMLDTSIWSKFKDSNNKSEYVIGGPTVEMLFKSYNKKYAQTDTYQAKAINANGYQISKDAGVNWFTWYSSMLDINNSLYVLPSTNGSLAMWMASPSAYNTTFVLRVYCQRTLWAVTAMTVVL